MRVTPLDIIRKEFSSSKRGFEPEAVRDFLEEIRESMEELLKENQRLRDQIGQKDAEIADLRDNESNIKQTLVLARQLSEDLKRGARREADVIVGEARIEAERILMATADEKQQMQADLVRLRSTRYQILADIRAVIETQGRLLDELDREVPAAR